MMKLEDLPTSVKDDALTLLCHELLGTGLSRQVYSCRLDPKRWVIKIDVNATGYFQNVCEYKVWESVEHIAYLSGYFAPVLNISDCGRFLVQARTQPVGIDELRKRLPKVPACFTDLKAENWGRLGKRIVCHDFGFMLTTENGLSRRMRKADWWD